MPRGTTSFDSLAVGQIAGRAGVAISALHFYERNHLITSTRDAGNQRRYTRDTLRRVAFIRASQRVGIPLAAIRDALNGLPQQRTPNAQDWAELAERWRTRLDESIDQLQRIRDDLTSCIGCGCLSLATCHLANPYDTMSREGPGPRRLLPGTNRPTPADPAPYSIVTASSLSGR